MEALLFRDSPISGQPVALVFGAADVAPNTELALSGALPALSGYLPVARVFDVVLASPLPGLTGSVQAAYISDSQRPTVAQLIAVAQIGQDVEVGIGQPEHHATRTNTGFEAVFEQALSISAALHAPYSAASPITAHRQGVFEDAQRYATQVLRGLMANADRQHLREVGVFEDATKTTQALLAKMQDGIIIRGPRKGRFDEAQRGPAVRYQGRAGAGEPVPRGVDGKFQEAWVPRPGVSPRPTVPVVVPPYWGAHLLFACPPLDFPNLVFGLTQCQVMPPGMVIVPVQRVYIVINNASLRRVDGNIQLPTFSMSLSLDVDSWTWGFSASMPAQVLANIEPASSGAPVEVEAMVNGVPYRALIESISRSREFGKSTITVQGRGKTALLDAPYAPVQNFANVGDRTAQQLMGDVLSVNGVPMPWTVTWGLTDWLVPAGVFTHQGSNIGALTRIAEAAGAYIQPHASTQTIAVLPRYPSVPWSWTSAIADYELPTAVTVTESVSWVEKARYNRVYVSGEQQGVLGQITRAGTAGDLLAPMITDSLITHADAARQRGLTVLSDTGRIASVSMRLPVLPATGIITPGKFVSYDGRIGIVRSVGVDIAMPDIYQTIGVETYVN